MVFEVDQDSKVIHLKSLGKPESPKKEKEEPVAAAPATVTEVDDGEKTKPEHTEEPTAVGDSVPIPEATASAAPAVKVSTKEEPWPEHFDSTLLPFLDEVKVAQLKKIVLEGPEPPRVSDGGWASRVAPSTTGEEAVPVETETVEEKASASNTRGRGGKRGGRGGRGGGRGGSRREDTRKVVSTVSLYIRVSNEHAHIPLCTQPITSKDSRTAFHKVIRELFGGKLDTETDASGPPEEGARIAIKWAKRGGRSDARGGREGNQRDFSFPVSFHILK